MPEDAKGWNNVAEIIKSLRTAGVRFYLESDGFRYVDQLQSLQDWQIAALDILKLSILQGLRKEQRMCVDCGTRHIKRYYDIPYLCQGCQNRRGFEHYHRLMAENSGRKTKVTDGPKVKARVSKAKAGTAKEWHKT